ncbi:hypothetical protein BDP27DRAFT_1521146 [Rhodocollybia butyracea]|uniref:Uncharacterized protein n=1 Tax=Rhodocollybia butyracea TaxID=206335 RepID=A0A9P5PNM4_9AGAR|nr:hypothetical protein BDP27DRAFT_1521146 [Rhodocollybia butyracea]
MSTKPHNRLRNFIVALENAAGRIHISSHTVQDIEYALQDLCVTLALSMDIYIEGWTYNEIMDLIYEIQWWKTGWLPEHIETYLTQPSVQQQLLDIWDVMCGNHRTKQNIIIMGYTARIPNDDNSLMFVSTLQSNPISEPTTKEPILTQPLLLRTRSEPLLLSRDVAPPKDVPQKLSNDIPHTSPNYIPYTSPNNVPHMLPLNNVIQEQQPTKHKQSANKWAVVENSPNIREFHGRPFLNRKECRAIRRDKRNRETAPAGILDGSEAIVCNPQMSQNACSIYKNALAASDKLGNAYRNACPVLVLSASLSETKVLEIEKLGIGERIPVLERQIKKRDNEPQPTLNGSEITTDDTSVRHNPKTSQKTSPISGTWSHDVTFLQHHLRHILSDDELTLQLYQALLKDKVAMSVLAAVMQALANKSIKLSNRSIGASDRVIESSSRSIDSFHRSIETSSTTGASGNNIYKNSNVPKQPSQLAESTQENFKNHAPEIAADTSKFMPSRPRASSVVESLRPLAKAGTVKSEINSTVVQRNLKTESSERTRRSEVQYDALAVTRITGSERSIKRPIVAQPASRSDDSYSHYRCPSNSNGSMESPTHTLPASEPHSRHHNYWERHKGKYAVKLQSENHHFTKVIAESPTKVSGSVPTSGHRAFEADMIKAKPRDSGKRQGREYAVKYTEKSRDLSERFNKRPDALPTSPHHREFRKSYRSSSLDSWLDPVKDNIEVKHHPTTYQPYHMNHHEQNNVQWCGNNSVHLGVRLFGAVDHSLVLESSNDEVQWGDTTRGERDLMSNSGNGDLDVQEAVNEEYPGMFDQGEWENDQDHRIMQEGTWERGYYSEDPHQQIRWNEGYGEYLEYIEMMEQNAHYQGPVFMEEEEEASTDPSEEHGDRMIDHCEVDGRIRKIPPLLKES